MEQSSLPFFRQRLVGRKIVIVLPVIIIIAAIILTVTVLPKSYYFTVRAGELYLVRGSSSGWIFSQRSSAMEPFSVKGLDLKGITGVAFKTQDEAMNVLRSSFQKRVHEQSEALLVKEKELADAYSDLLRDLTGAKAAGTPGLDKNIEVLKGWLEIYNTKMKPAMPAAKS
ncbi:MAG: hypothetical protein NTU74_15070 [Deltaproteobacteria bacterium]|nr:hypothetical protein [Deltaproteobacteria bacterium]